MLDFGIKDAIDILLFAVLLYYIYRLMKESGTINIFYGVLAFIVVWVLASEIFDMRLIGTILDKFMSIGLIILVILFQEPIKRFLVELGSQRRWRFLSKLFHHHKEEIDNEALAWVMPIVYACMSMSKSKTGALIVIEQSVPLDNYSASGDRIDALINTRLIENIFFKNSAASRRRHDNSPCPYRGGRLHTARQPRQRRAPIHGPAPPLGARHRAGH